jgi:hypothetical protein
MSGLKKKSTPAKLSPNQFITNPAYIDDLNVRIRLQSFAEFGNVDIQAACIKETIIAPNSL